MPRTQLACLRAFCSCRSQPLYDFCPSQVGRSVTDMQVPNKLPRVVTPNYEGALHGAWLRRSWTPTYPNFMVNLVMVMFLWFPVASGQIKKMGPVIILQPA